MNFAYDNEKQAYHAQVDTWQRKFGYNYIYDEVFHQATKMKKDEFQFTYNNKEHKLWMWKGDYCNFSSGAEFGLYVNNSNSAHYDAVDFELPMTLSLYNYDSSEKIINIFSWMPEDPQWWITGFNTEFKQPVSEKMAFIGSIDLSGNWNLFNSMSLNKDNSNNSDILSYLIFDEQEHKVWIIYDEGVKR